MADEEQPPTAPPAAEAPPGPDFKDLYLRAAAELDNYRKRVEKDRAGLIQSASESIVRRLLDPFDNLDRAVVDLTRLKAEAPPDLQGPLGRSLDGVRALQRQLFELMAAEGVVPIEAHGAAFDPSLHEALATLPHATVPAGHIVEVLRPGYTIRGRLLRPAAVAVSAGPSPEAADPAGPEARPAEDAAAHSRAPKKGAPKYHQT
jgi:molecular chaperone GrpE